MNKQKYWTNLSKKDVEKLTWIVSNSRFNWDEMISLMIANEAFIRLQLARGTKFYMQEPGQQLKEVAFRRD